MSKPRWRPKTPEGQQGLFAICARSGAYDTQGTNQAAGFLSSTVDYAALLAEPNRKRTAILMFRKAANPKTLTGSLDAALQKENISYVFFQVREDKLEDIQGNLSRAIDLMLDSDGLVEAIMSSIACAVFKTNPRSEKRPVDILLDELGQNVRAVYGQGEVLRGTVGSQRRFTYGTVFPNLSMMLQVLLQIDFGSSREI